MNFKLNLLVAIYSFYCIVCANGLSNNTNESAGNVNNASNTDGGIELNHTITTPMTTGKIAATNNTISTSSTTMPSTTLMLNQTTSTTTTATTTPARTTSVNDTTTDSTEITSPVATSQIDTTTVASINNSIDNSGTKTIYSIYFIISLLMISKFIMH